MQSFTGLRQPVDKPGALLLAIREWQRQLIEMGQAAKHPAPAERRAITGRPTMIYSTPRNLVTAGSDSPHEIAEGT